jgi:hypothetical protein
VSSLAIHLVKDDDERDDERVVDAGVHGDLVGVLPQQRADDAEAAVDPGDDGVGVAEGDGAGAFVVAPGDPEVADLLCVVAGEEHAHLGRLVQRDRRRLRHGEHQVAPARAVAAEHVPARVQQQRLQHRRSGQSSGGERIRALGMGKGGNQRIDAGPIPGR